jgi:hypothetical protein
VSVSVVLAGLRYRQCDEWRANSIRAIIALRPSLILMSNRRDQEIFVAGRRRWIDSSDAARVEWQAGMARTLNSLRPAGGRIIVLRDTPPAGFDIPSCLARHVRRAEQCAFAREQGDGWRVGASEQQAIREFGAASLVDLTDEICGPVTCPALRDDIPVFRDSHHLSVARSRALAPALWKALEHDVAAAVRFQPAMR